MYMQQKEAIYYLASKKFTWLVDSFIYRSPWQVSQKVSLQPCLYTNHMLNFYRLHSHIP